MGRDEAGTDEAGREAELLSGCASVPAGPSSWVQVPPGKPEVTWTPWGQQAQPGGSRHSLSVGGLQEGQEPQTGLCLEGLPSPPTPHHPHRVCTGPVHSQPGLFSMPFLPSLTWELLPAPPRAGDSTSFPVPVPDHPRTEETSPNIQFKPSRCDLRVFPPVLPLVSWDFPALQVSHIPPATRARLGGSQGCHAQESRAAGAVFSH